MKTKTIATFFAILAAALYAINIPLSKIAYCEANRPGLRSKTAAFCF